MSSTESEVCALLNIVQVCIEHVLMIAIMRSDSNNYHASRTAVSSASKLTPAASVQSSFHGVKLQWPYNQFPTLKSDSSPETLVVTVCVL